MFTEAGFSPEALRERDQERATNSLFAIAQRLEAEGKRVLFAAVPALAIMGSARAQELPAIEQGDAIVDAGELPSTVLAEGFTMDVAHVKRGDLETGLLMRVGFTPKENGFVADQQGDATMVGDDVVPVAFVHVDATDDEARAARRDAFRKTAKDVVRAAMEMKNARMTTLEDRQYYGWKFHVPLDSRSDMFVTPYFSYKEQGDGMVVDGIYVKVDIEEIRPGKVSPWK